MINVYESYLFCENNLVCILSLSISGEINTISDLPSYTKYWRNKFERRFEEIQANGQVGCDKTVLNNVLLEYMTCLQTEIPETEEHLSNDKSKKASKQEFYFLSDVLPEDKVRRQY